MLYLLNSFYIPILAFLPELYSAAYRTALIAGPAFCIVGLSFVSDFAFVSDFLSVFPAFFFGMCSRFDLVSFRLSCDHGWIRSGSVNLRYNNRGFVFAAYDPT